MKRAWFRSWGSLYRPVALPGWLVVAVAAAFCINVFVVVDRHSHSVSDTLYGVFPFIVPTLGIVGWIASRTSVPAGQQE